MRIRVSTPRFIHIRQAMKYSVQRVFIMRNDDGREVGRLSRLGGPRWPRDWRTSTGRTGTAPSEILLFRTAWICQGRAVEICCANTGRCCYRKSATRRPGAGHTDHPGKRLAFLIPRAHLAKDIQAKERRLKKFDVAERWQSKRLS